MKLSKAIKHISVGALVSAVSSVSIAQTVTVTSVGTYGGDGTGGDTSGNLIIFLSGSIGTSCPDYPGATLYPPRLDISATNPRRKEIQNLATIAMLFGRQLVINTNGKCIFYPSTGYAIATISATPNPASYVTLY